MTPRRVILVSLILPAVAAIWIAVGWKRPIGRYAVLQYLPTGPTNSVGQVAGAGTFYVTNLSDRPIALNASCIDVKDGGGWRMHTNFVPWDLRSLGPFQSGYCAVDPPPGQAPWRVHLWVSRETHGLESIPCWLRYYADYRTWQSNRRFSGWKLWDWPPFGRNAKVTFYDNAFELISGEIGDKTALTTRP